MEKMQKSQKTQANKSASDKKSASLLEQMPDSMLMELLQLPQGATIKEAQYQGNDTPHVITIRYPNDRLLTMSYRVGSVWDVPERVYLTSRVRDSQTGAERTYQRLLPVSYFQQEPYRAFFDQVWGPGRRDRLAQLIGNALQGSNAKSSSVGVAEPATGGSEPATGGAGSGMGNAASGNEARAALSFGSVLGAVGSLFERYMGRPMGAEDYVKLNEFHRANGNALTNPEEFAYEFLRQKYWSRDAMENVGNAQQGQQPNQQQGLLGNLFNYLSSSPKDLVELLTLVLLMQSMRRS